MLTYNWTIENLDHRTADGFVCCAHWRCTATESDFTASVYGTVGFNGETPAIPYDSLTPQEVLNWVWGSDVGKDATEAQLAEEINALKNPAQESGLPWA